jgi:hypothetical protein
VEDVLLILFFLAQLVAQQFYLQNLLAVHQQLEHIQCQEVIFFNLQWQAELLMFVVLYFMV